MDINDLNGQFFNTPISEYRVNIRKSSDDSAILNDVRFCNAESKLKKKVCMRLASITLFKLLQKAIYPNLAFFKSI